MSITAVPGEHLLTVFEALLTPEECTALIAWADATRDAADHPGDRAWHLPRNNPGKYARAIRVSEAWADKLWARVQPHLPETLNGYRLLYVNPFIRFSRYRAGGLFPVHRDGKNYDAKGAHGWAAESLLTLNINLNAGFAGGHTDFFEEPRAKRGALPPPAKLRISVEPRPGQAALFWADQLHRGNVVQPTAAAEFKYLMRTDIMGIRE